MNIVNHFRIPYSIDQYGICWMSARLFTWLKNLDTYAALKIWCRWISSFKITEHLAVSREPEEKINVATVEKKPLRVVHCHANQFMHLLDKSNLYEGCTHSFTTQMESIWLSFSDSFEHLVTSVDRMSNSQIAGVQSHNAPFSSSDSKKENTFIVTHSLAVFPKIYVHHFKWA